MRAQSGLARKLNTSDFSVEKHFNVEKLCKYWRSGKAVGEHWGITEVVTKESRAAGAGKQRQKVNIEGSLEFKEGILPSVMRFRPLRKEHYSVRTGTPQEVRWGPCPSEIQLSEKQGASQLLLRRPSKAGFKKMEGNRKLNQFQLPDKELLLE